MRNGQKIVDQPSMKANDQGILHILKSSSDVFGRYHCQAQNEHGLSVSPPIDIKTAGN